MVHLMRAASWNEDALPIMLLKGPGLDPLLLLQALQMPGAQHEFLHKPHHPDQHPFILAMHYQKSSRHSLACERLCDDGNLLEVD